MFRSVIMATVGVFLMGSVCQAQSIFYQPSLADQDVSPSQWHDIWHQTAQNGIHTVIVQWTQYGDIDFGGKDGWLYRTLDQAHAAGLDLVMGLYMDPAYYRRLSEIDAAAYDDFLQLELGQSLKKARDIQTDWQLPIAGWYLPLELDDWNYQGATERDTINDLLGGLSRRLDAPLHVSAFASGRLAPSVYGNWLKKLSKEHIQVWAQDGKGTGALSGVVGQTYLDSIPCDVGIVREAFRQTSKQGETFDAKPVTEFDPATSSEGCHAQAVFELRYVPWGQDIASGKIDVHTPPEQYPPEQ
ncbi:DUF4434 domain-containing protein [Thalassospira sp. MA62]|nr:DUF4434 domain-containing protein [Thalassospira sp. MA62]